MTWGNRLFWGLIFFFGFHLLWLGILERFGPVWIATIVGAIFVFYMLKYGPRPKEKEEERKGA